ncbi:MAG: nucleotide exchange factor GrpE [bacterium]
MKLNRKKKEVLETPEEEIADMTEEDFAGQAQSKKEEKSTLRGDDVKVSNQEYGIGEDKLGQEEKKSESFNEQLKLLESQLDKKNNEVKEVYDRLVRLQAEFENYKKRMVKEKEDFSRYAQEKLVCNLLPVVDNLERAKEAAQKSENYQALLNGLDLVLTQFVDVLKKEGVECIKSCGEKFDPNKHEAIMQVESKEHQENIVVQELQKGYVLNDRVIRASMVAVAKK